MREEETRPLDVKDPRRLGGRHTQPYAADQSRDAKEGGRQ